MIFVCRNKTYCLVILNLERGTLMEIGNRLKQLRTRKNLTLEELADRCELSKGFLSQLERDLTSPSISTLEDICEVLGISLSSFFKEEEDDQLVFKKDDFYVKENEDSSITWLVPNAQNNEMEPIMYDLSPGAKTSEMAPYEGEEFGYVLRGNLTLVNVTRDERYHLKRGDTFYMKGMDTHYLQNDSDHDTKFIWICTPPVF